MVNGISFRRDQAEKVSVSKTKAANKKTRNAPIAALRKTKTGKASNAKAEADKTTAKKKRTRKPRIQGAARKRRARGATARASQEQPSKETSIEVNAPEQSQHEKTVIEVEVVEAQPDPVPNPEQQATTEEVLSSEMEDNEMEDNEMEDSEAAASPASEVEEAVAPASNTSESTSTSDGIRLGPALSINEVVELKAMFDDVPGEDVIVIGLSAVEKVDTAGIQLLLAFQQQAENFGQQVEWKAPSEVLKRAAENLGLADRLGFGTPSSTE